MSDNCEHIMSKNILTAFPRPHMVLPMKDMKTQLMLELLMRFKQ